MLVELIEVNTQSLAAEREDMEGQINAVKKNVQMICEEIEELSAMWEGPAKAAFQSQLKGDFHKLTEFCASVAEYIAHIGMAADEYQKCEHKVAEVIAAVNV